MRFDLLDQADKDYVASLVKDSHIEDLGAEIDDYAYQCLDLEEISQKDLAAWKTQLLAYGHSLEENRKESSKGSLKESLFPSEKCLTVGALIEELSKFPKDWPVNVYTYDRGSILGGCEGWGWVEKVSRAQYDDDGVSLNAYHGERRSR